ncbi:HTH-type transcriptional regulator PerR [Ensifer psoraleae]|uniref:LysR family transcriptional regulator n=1 Tax=Sinorhizobium psoraleae TaxID=520838 RepID=UPI001568931C|nr:LysR family transcriptional regulator [Sinorhizobium psoraleae]NRP72934.1 HTH-type transcriptional regulator PerR [Sinorhizobium psoraleae]
MRASLSAIRVFEAAARLGSFKDAAGELGLTSTAVSHRVRGLEGDLGVDLFRRSHRKVELTQAGAELLEAARAAVSLLENAIDRISSETRSVTLTTTPAFAALWLAPRISEFQAQFPNLSLRTEASHTSIDLERTRGIDAAVRYSLSTSSEGQLLVREGFKAFASPGTFARQAETRSVAVLSYRWRSRGLENLALDPWETALGQHGSLKVISYDDEHHAALAAVSGKGIVVLSDVLAQHLVSSALLEDVLPDVSIPGHCYRIMVPNRTRADRDTRQVLEWLQDEMRSLRT